MLSFMAVMAREQWTDQRLDDLKENVSHRFDEVDQRFDRVEADIRELRVEIRAHRSENKADFKRVDDEFGKVRAEMKAGFAEVSGRIDGRIDGVHGRIGSMQRTMIIGFVTLFTGIVASIITAILAG